MIVISGLRGDGYLIDNPIWIELTNTVTNIRYVSVRVQNLYNGKILSEFRLYPFGNVCKFNLSTIAKGLFSEPKHNENYNSTSQIEIPTNANKLIIELEFNYENGTIETRSIEKTFVRGGDYSTYDLMTNRVVQSGALLQNASRVPRWRGYPVASYHFTNEKKIVKRNLNHSGLVTNAFELMRAKTCDGAYVKFLNSKGGYSYWLFEDWKNTSENDYLGYTTGMRDITDLGSEAEFEFEAFTKVPLRYLGLMTDLIYSKEIYLYLNNGSQGKDDWKRIVVKSGNKIEQKRKSVAYGITIKFEQVKNYNPALIW